MTAANPYLVDELIAAGLPRREARWLIEEFMPGGDHDAIAALRAATQRRLDGEPLQYVIGHWPFRSLDLDLDHRVLIPRPETEELVEVAIDELATSRVVAPMILDLGCGSGAIGLSILFELRTRGVGATLVALDRSSDALDVARRNALKHHLHAVSFVASTWFDDLDDSLRGRFDLVVANPPYVSADEMASADAVLDYEPRAALVANDASDVPGFADLAVIISAAPQWLTPEGVLVVEHGYLQRDAVLCAAARAGFESFQDRDDFAGHPRVLVARR